MMGVLGSVCSGDSVYVGRTTSALVLAYTALVCVMESGPLLKLKILLKRH